MTTPATGPAAGSVRRAPAPAVGRPRDSDALLLVIALTAVSTSGPLIAAAAVPALAIACWRNALASGLLVPAVLLRCRDELRGLDPREKRLAALAGLLLALHFATWTPALSYTSVASATALVATQPVWAALISGLRGVPVERAGWLGIAVAMSGAVLLAGVDLQLGGRALLGDLLAVAGGAFDALLAAVFLGQRPPLLALPAALLLVAGVALVIRAGGRDTTPSLPVE